MSFCSELSGGLAADIALVWPLPSVRTKVPSQVSTLSETLATVLARKWCTPATCPSGQSVLNSPYQLNAVSVRACMD